MEFVAVVKAVNVKASYFHWPDRPCFNGKCKRSALAPTSSMPVPRGCNWKDIRHLARSFWQTAPDVNEHWNRFARNSGLNAEEFHDILLGVFIAGADAEPYYGPSLLDAVMNEITSDLKETS